MWKPELWDGDLTGPPGEQGMIDSTHEFKTDFESGEELDGLMERIQESMRRELAPERTHESCIRAELQTKALGAE